MSLYHVPKRPRADDAAKRPLPFLELALAAASVFLASLVGIAASGVLPL
jgi:hypothetical protein